MKSWAYVAGKVRIGERWEDPTLDSPILRRLPLGWQLSLEEPPKSILASADTWVTIACALAYIVLFAQALGFLRP